MSTFMPLPTARKAVPMAAVVLPFPGPVFTMMRPRLMSSGMLGKALLNILFSQLLCVKGNNLRHVVQVGKQYPNYNVILLSATSPFLVIGFRRAHIKLFLRDWPVPPKSHCVV